MECRKVGQAFLVRKSRPTFNRHFRNREPAQPMKEFNFEKELLGVQDELFRFAYKLTANREKAEDLLQDTLLKAMLHKESYNKNTNLKGGCLSSCATRLSTVTGRRSVIPACTYLRSCILFPDHGRVPYRGGGQEL